MGARLVRRVVLLACAWATPACTSSGGSTSQLVAGAACAADGDCKSGLCLHGACAGDACSEGCRPLGGSCSYSGTCDPGWECRSLLTFGNSDRGPGSDAGFAAVRCAKTPCPNDSACPDGYACENLTCVPRPPSVHIVDPPKFVATNSELHLHAEAAPTRWSGATTITWTVLGGDSSTTGPDFVYPVGEMIGGFRVQARASDALGLSGSDVAEVSACAPVGTDCGRPQDGLNPCCPGTSCVAADGGGLGRCGM